MNGNLLPQYLTKRLRTHGSGKPPWQLGGCCPPSLTWIIGLGRVFYFCRFFSISKSKGVRLKILPIDFHLGLAIVGPGSLFQRSVAHNTNSYAPTFDGRTSFRKATYTPFLKHPQLCSDALIGTILYNIRS